LRLQILRLLETEVTAEEVNGIKTRVAYYIEDNEVSEWRQL